MGVQLPGDLIPGAVGVLETQGTVITISDSATQGTATFTLGGAHDVAPDVTTGAGIDALSGASASSKVTDENITTRTADTVEVQVTLDTAPGTGETTDVYVGITAGSGGD